jgi:uncharacterized protein YajQ (UPF0234 family)
MPSFDIQSKVDPQALLNTVNVVKREIETRYDLRGTNSTVEFDPKALTLRVSTEDPLKLDSIVDILLERSGKQKVDVRSFDLSAEPVPSGKMLHRTITVKQGIDRDQGHQGQWPEGAGPDHGRHGAGHRQEDRRPAGRDGVVPRGRL